MALRPNSRQPGTLFRFVFELTVTILVLATLAGCYPAPGDPVGIAAPVSPFERSPWIQDVDHNSAMILWMITADEASSIVDHIEYRQEGTNDSWTTVPGVQHSGRIRAASLTGLPGGTTIEYRASTNNTLHPVTRFRTAPDPDSVLWPVRVLLFGDSGWGGEEQVRLARQMQAGTWDLLVHLGDAAYRNGTENEFTKRHFRVYADILQSTPMFPSVGNHDLHTNDGAAYDASFVWHSPYAGERYYAYRWGGVQFVSLDTSSETEDVADLRNGRGRQFDWLKQVLQAAYEDPAISWTVVYMHHPLFSQGFGISGHGGDYQLRVALAPLFENWGVDLVAAGHEHHYERTTPVRKRRKVPSGCGPVYVVAGTGGASRYARAVGTSSITAASSREYSFVELSIEGAVMVGRTIRQDGSLLDEFEIQPFDSKDSVACLN